MSCRVRARSRRRCVYVRRRSTADRAGIASTRSAVPSRTNQRDWAHRAENLFARRTQIARSINIEDNRLLVAWLLPGPPFPRDRRRERTTKLPHSLARLGVGLGVGGGRRAGVGRAPDGLPGWRFRGGGPQHVGAARGGARPPPGCAARRGGRGGDRRREGVRGPARRAVVAGARQRRRGPRRRGDHRDELLGRRRGDRRDDFEPGRRRGPRGVRGVGGEETTLRGARQARRRLRRRFPPPIRRRGHGPRSPGGPGGSKRVGPRRRHTTGTTGRGGDGGGAARGDQNRVAREEQTGRASFDHPRREPSGRGVPRVRARGRGQVRLLPRALRPRVRRPGRRGRGDLRPDQKQERIRRRDGRARRDASATIRLPRRPGGRQGDVSELVQEDRAHRRRRAARVLTDRHAEVLAVRGGPQGARGALRDDRKRRARENRRPAGGRVRARVRRQGGRDAETSARR